MAMEIRTTNALIGVNRTPAKLDIKQPQAEVDRKITHAQVNVELSLPKIQIDQTQAFAESGLKKPLDLTAEIAQYSKSKMEESTGRIAEQGDALTDIHTGADVIADQALYNAYDQFSTEYNMVTMPRSRPEITVIEGDLDIKVKEGTIDEQTEIRRPEINNKAGKVEVYLKQRNSISMKYVGDSFDMKL